MWEFDRATDFDPDSPMSKCINVANFTGWIRKRRQQFGTRLA
jgi:hypothetical protein